MFTHEESDTYLHNSVLCNYIDYMHSNFSDGKTFEEVAEYAMFFSGHGKIRKSQTMYWMH